MVGDRIGAYRLMRLLGVGATGRVFEVEHERIGRRAAMKTLASAHAAHPSAIKRLFIEALAVNRINNPHIVEVTDIVERGVHEPRLRRTSDGPVPPVNAIVMELLEGQSLAQAVAEHGPMEPGRFLAVLAQVCRALAAAHAAGFVHRDLKPDNIFLVDRGSKDFVKLLDFGLTKAFGAVPGMSGIRSLATLDGFFVGTPAYVSPEQASGRAIDHRTDIYAVGIILFELICGRLPFEGPNVNEFLIQQVTTPAPPLPPEVRATKLGATLDAIVQRCLEKDPEARFPSAARLARIFDDLARGGDVAFTGIGSYLAVQERSQRARGRGEALRATAGLALGLLLALGAGVGLAHLRSSTHLPGPPVRPTLSHVDVTPPPVAPPPPAEVTLLFESDPTGAEVRFANRPELLGVTPFRRAVARSTDEITFDIRLAGYNSMQVPTPATSNRTISVGLTHEQPQPPPPSRPSAKAPAKALEKAAGSRQKATRAREKPPDPVR
jgi:serine/threonine-protein kinase